MNTVYTFESNVIGEHNTQHAVVGCMDFRLQESRIAFMKEQGVEHFDNCVMPGACKNYLENRDGCAQLSLAIEVALGLHSGEEIWIFHHTDCGAYGGNKAFDSIETEIQFQQDQLEQAAAKITSERIEHNKPVPKIHLFIEHINLETQSIEYINVTPQEV